MASWTTPTTLSTAVPLPSAYYNILVNNEIFLYQKPYAMYYNSVSTSCPNGVGTPISLGGVTASGYGFSVLSNNVIVPLAGIYQVNFAVGFGATTVGYIQSTIVQNGTSAIAGTSSTTSAFNSQSGGSGQLICSAGDALGLLLFQGTGATITSFNNSAVSYLHAFFIGSQ